MIDTDKYEGHLMDKAVEDNSQVWVWKNWMLKNTETIEQHEATAALLNDAPLLLAEVKRLQRYEREHKELWDIVANFSPQDSEADEDIHRQWLESVSQGYMGSVYEYIMMKQEEMIE
jgi:hypothetical protein